MENLKPITLANIEQSSAQEVFDWVVFNLIKQGSKSVADLGDNIPSCAYRGEDGKKCAAGWCIADEEFRDHFENTAWINLVDRQLVPEAHGDLMAHLQNVHDSYQPENWPEYMELTATRFKLSTAVLDELCPIPA